VELRDPFHINGCYAERVTEFHLPYSGLFFNPFFAEKYQCLMPDNAKLSGSVLRSEAEQNRIRWSAGLTRSVKDFLYQGLYIFFVP